MEVRLRRHSWDIANLDSPFHTVVLVCLVATLSYVSTALGLLTIIDPTITIAPVWPTNALLLVVLLAVPRRVWTILIATAYVVVALLDLKSGDSIASASWLVLANVIEVLIAVWGVSYFFKNVPRINSARALAQYSLFAVILAPFVGALVAGLAGAQGDYWLHWKVWFLSDSLAFLTLPPAVWGLLHLGSKWRHKSRAYYLELATLTATLGLFGYITFVASARSLSPALLYTLVPFLLWSVFRFGSIGVSASVIVVAVLSIWGAGQGRGPFTEPGPISNVLSLQLFLLFTAAPFMVLAALIEERRRAEEELREGEDKLRLLLESTAEAIYGIDIEGRCTFCNPACLRSLGYERVDELLGKNMHDLIHHSRADGRMFPVEECQIVRAFQTGKGVHAEDEVLWKADGKSFCAEYWSYPQQREGKIVGAVVTFIDITERKLAEEALRESEERLRLAAQIGKMYAYDWDVATDVVIRSEEATRILGLSGESIGFTKQQLLAIVHPEDRAQLISANAAITPESPNVQTSSRFLRPDGSILWLERTGHAFFDEQGRMVRMIGMVADVTDRKLAEEALSKVGGRLIEAHEEERSRIARDLHDDIGQRLALLINDMDQLEKDLPDSAVEVRNRIQEQLKRVHEIASDTQAMSHQLHSSKLRLLGIVAAAKGFCQELSEQQNVEIEFTHADIPPAVPEEISLCLFRVMQEALHNAVKHSGVRHFEVQLRRASGEIQLTIRDSGVGFNPDESMMNSRGLGLISMRERVSLVRGTFSATSKPQQGTEIYIRVPLSAGMGMTQSAG